MIGSPDPRGVSHESEVSAPSETPSSTVCSNVRRDPDSWPRLTIRMGSDGPGRSSFQLR